MQPEKMQPEMKSKCDQCDHELCPLCDRFGFPTGFQDRTWPAASEEELREWINNLFANAERYIDAKWLKIVSR